MSVAASSVVGMDLVELQPAVSMSGDELVAALDAVHASRAQLDSYELQLIARLHEIGHAQEVGAHDTTRFVATRYRVDTGVARRKVDLATTLNKYPVVAAALSDPFASTSSDGATTVTSGPRLSASRLAQVRSEARSDTSHRSSVSSTTLSHG